MGKDRSTVMAALAARNRLLAWEGRPGRSGLLTQRHRSALASAEASRRAGDLRSAALALETAHEVVAEAALL